MFTNCEETAQNKRATSAQKDDNSNIRLLC